jgi:uncharacterized membrane protein
MASNAVDAVGIVLMKSLLGDASFWTAFAWTRIGALVILVPLMLMHAPSLVATVREKGARVVGLLAAGESLAQAANLSFIVALSLGSATLVAAICSFQPLFVFLFALGVSIAAPHLLKEELTRGVLAQKGVGIALIILGAVLVA